MRNLSKAQLAKGLFALFAMGGGSLLPAATQGGGLVPEYESENCVVGFTLNYQAASKVWLTGEFTGWAATPEQGAIEMKKDALGLWTAGATIARGDNQYRYIIDGSNWIQDPENPFQSLNDFGDYNSVVRCQKTEFEPQQCGDPNKFDWRDTVMYFAMVDRFFDSDNQSVKVEGVTDYGRQAASGQYLGGDLKGLEAKLPYLKKLGVSSLWMTAPNDNRDYRGDAVDPSIDGNFYSAYHGYWPSPEYIDYSDINNPQPRPKVESRIGTDADLRSLIDSAHATEAANGQGMKVIFDYVMNHADIASGLYRDKPNWFARDDGRFRLCQPENLWEDEYWGTRCSFTNYLPALDLHQEEVRNWSINDAYYWAAEYGVDGLRLDAIKHVPKSWLYGLKDKFNRDLQRPEGEAPFYLVGETYDYVNRDVLKSFVDPGRALDGQFDFPYRKQLCDALFRPEGDLGQFAAFVASNERYYDGDKPALMANWIGNHDIPRAIHFANGEISSCFEGSSAANGWNSGAYQSPNYADPYDRLALSFAVLMTSHGIPLIYYGDEIALPGGGDPDNRRAMIWDDSQLNAFQKQLREDVSFLANLRGEKKALGRGKTKTYFADKDRWVYQRGGCGEEMPTITVGINGSDWGRVVPIPSGVYRDLKTGLPVFGGQYYLGPRGYALLELIEDQVTD